MKKGLRENEGKTKVMVCCTGLYRYLLQNSRKFLCTVCHTCVGNNSIYCNGCKHLDEVEEIVRGLL